MIITITNFPLKHKTYFQWLILGLYELQNSKQIKLRFRANFFVWILTITNNPYITEFICRILSKYIDKSDLLEGYTIINNVKKKFCFDCFDTPFIFDDAKLKQVDYYFKMQCPKEISLDGFPLTNNIKIQYSKIALENSKKIFPGMIGMRRMTWGLKYKALKKSYLDALQVSNTSKLGKLMCYFGDSLGPNIDTNKIITPNFHSESDLLNWFGNQIEHPNIKRQKAAIFISELGENYDARIINVGNSDSLSTNKNATHAHLIIPLNEFSKHISNFQYNLNISGYRNSIPNRFIESFMVGTAIFTDKLSVKWFEPFENEVVETVEMGYLKINNVDWNKFKNDLMNLPNIDKNEIIESYNRKWTPLKFASYFIKTLKYN